MLFEKTVKHTNKATGKVTIETLTETVPDYAPSWNFWTGCKKVSPGCKNCWLTNFTFAKQDIDNSWNLVKNQIIQGKVKYPFVICSLYTDLFLEEGDEDRKYVWDIIRKETGYLFLIITKRPERIKSCLPEDWNDGYNNVIISVTTENQTVFKERIPYLIDLKAKHKWIHLCPLLSEIDLLKDNFNLESIESISMAGEICADYAKLRITKFEWFKKIAQQAAFLKIRLTIHECGHKFLMNNRLYRDCGLSYRSSMADSLKLHNRLPLSYKLETDYDLLELVVR